MDKQRIHALARAVDSLSVALQRLELEGAGDLSPLCSAAAERGHFAPEDDEIIRAWFARYLTIRGGLLEIVDDLRPVAQADGGDQDLQHRAFLVAYAAASVLVGAARFLVDEFATHTLVQRKFNEGDPAHRVPRKQYTSVYRSLTRPAYAWQLALARQFAEEHAAELSRLAQSDPALGRAYELIGISEDAMETSVRRAVKSRLLFRWHSLRRRRASAAQQGTFAVCEAFGRMIAELRPWWRRDRVRPALQHQIAAILEPGDVIIARHDRALSNLFLPGYWPHAALYIGNREGAVELSTQHAERWNDQINVLEARKDGVLFRPIEDTLSVDAVAVLRPRLSRAHITDAIGRAIAHEGKEYDFDFDFFRSDTLVCTEVIYRAFDGVGGLQIPLQTRAGRPTLSAEDLIGMSIAEDAFRVVAVYGTPGVRRLVLDEAARKVLERQRAAFEAG